MNQRISSAYLPVFPSSDFKKYFDSLKTPPDTDSESESLKPSQDSSSDFKKYFDSLKTPPDSDSDSESLKPSQDSSSDFKKYFDSLEPPPDTDTETESDSESLKPYQDSESDSESLKPYQDSDSDSESLKPYQDSDSESDSETLKKKYNIPPPTPQTPSQTFAQTPDQTPSQTLAQTPSQTLAQTPAQTLAQTPSQTQDQTPAQTLAQTPSQTQDQTFDYTIDPTLDQSMAMEIDEIVPKDYNIIEQISLTYDTTLIEDFEKTLQDSFHSIASKVNTKYNNTVLQKLVENHAKNNKPITDFIIGPKNLTVHFSKEYNKLIYTFGEYHVEDLNCKTFNNPLSSKTIEDYLFDLYQNTDVFIDFFFEFPSFGRKQKTYKYRNIDREFYSKKISLYKLFEKFKKCIEVPTRNDETCQLGRVHFFNVRDSSFLAKYSYLMIECVNHQTIAEFLNINKNTSEFFNQFIKIVTDRTGTITSNRLQTYFNANNLGNIYNVHEIKKVNIEMYKKITTFIKLEIKNKIDKSLYIVRYNIDIINKRDKSATAVTNEVGIAFTAISGFFINVVAIMADIYTLARMFKKFNLNKKGFKGAIRGDQPDETHNIIIYAGDKHSQLYRRFFNYLNFECINYTGQADNKLETCIDMSPINQPFFTKKSREKKISDTEMEVDFDFNFYFEEGVLS
jgi:hypothetical protein